MGPALLALFLLILALALFWLARRGRVRSGLPRGRVVYADTRAWKRLPEPLRAPRYRLAGRPDYVVRRGRDTIPVEVKPGRSADEPYEADVLQLAAYCLLVAEHDGRPPPHGLLVYRDRAFEIPFDAGLRRALVDTLQDMRRDERRNAVPRSHDQPARCAACSVRGHCGEECLV